MEAKDIHNNYYLLGSYPDERYHWTVQTFLYNVNGKRCLDVGCGDGKLLELLQGGGNEVYGVDASISAVQECKKKGIRTLLLDMNHERLPFSDDYFDICICLETLEHLTNPYHAIMEIRRVLKENGIFIVSVPNPWTGHLYIYPGLFEFRFFRQFLDQVNLRIERIEPYEWAPRETILPKKLKHVRPLRSRYVAGVLRRIVEKVFRTMGYFPWFCYWCWTFECRNENKGLPSVLEQQAEQTRPKG